MRRFSVLVPLSLVLLLPGCISFKLTAEGDPSLKASGLGSAYVGYSGFDEWDGTILKVGLLWGEGRAGEIFSFDIWPLGGIGIGLAGARVRVLPVEMGAGALFYKPRLPRRQPALEDLPPHEELPQGEPAQGEPAKGEPAKGEPTKGEPAKGEPTKGEPTQVPVEEAKATSEAGHKK